MSMIQLKTRWAEGITAENVQQEYPIPMLVRDSFFNLNGEWEYGISQSAEIEKYDGSILVPFSPETMLSGVQKLVMPTDFLRNSGSETRPNR